VQGCRSHPNLPKTTIESSLALQCQLLSQHALILLRTTEHLIISRPERL